MTLLIQQSDDNTEEGESGAETDAEEEATTEGPPSDPIPEESNAFEYPTTCTRYLAVPSSSDYPDSSADDATPNEEDCPTNIDSTSNPDATTTYSETGKILSKFKSTAKIT